MKRAIGKHIGDFSALLVLIAIALGVSYYILQEQRLRIPFLEEKAFVLKGEFSTGQAVTAGQGQTVRVAGVRIGDIGDVDLEDGRAIIEMHLDQEYRDLVRTDATALLRPKTGLKDMFVDLDPGTDEAPVADEGWTIPIRNTQPDVNPDEIYSVLDADTRDYLRLLVNGAGRGLEGRGGDLRDVFRRFEPTHRDLARVNSQVALRRRNLRRLISSLRILSQELADHDDDLARLIGSSSDVLRSFASEEQSISAAVRELPGALGQTTSTLTRVERFAKVLGPVATRLRPAARQLDSANRATTKLGREVTPLLQREIRPFVREARPLVKELRGPARRLSGTLPDLAKSFEHINGFFNLVAYNENGREPPEDEDRQEGYLYWAAWLSHVGAQLFSTSDAHGTFRPTTLGAPCNTIEMIVREEPHLEFLTGLTPILTDSEACATGP